MGSIHYLSIGAVARQTGLSVPTIRYYEEVGLLPSAPRSESGQRQYGPPAVRRLAFIRRCRDFGFAIEQVRALATLVDSPGQPCVEVRQVAAVHLAAVRRKLVELHALENSLARVVASCDATCAGGSAADCAILEDLAVPAEPAAVVRQSACCAV